MFCLTLLSFLIYGAGGDGKSMSAWALAKHIATGKPFVVPWQSRSSATRSCRSPEWRSTSRSTQGTAAGGGLPHHQRQHDPDGLAASTLCPVHQAHEEASAQAGGDRLLIGCSGGRAFDENKSDFATPLYWLTKNNGVLFPKATILIVHHANKNGGFSGTSAIRDAVDETWALRKPTDEERGVVGSHSRLITIEKSRSGRMGTQLVMQMQDDLSFTISDFTPEVDETNTSPASVTDRVLQKLRVVYPESRTKDDLVCDPLIDGKPAAIHKSLQRLEKRGLVVSNVPKHTQSKNWTAVLARGEGRKCPPFQQNQCWSGIYPWTPPLDKSKVSRVCLMERLRLTCLTKRLDTSNLSTPSVQGLIHCYHWFWSALDTLDIYTRVRDELD